MNRLLVMPEGLERKDLPIFEAKMIAEDNGYLTGYAAVKGNVDSYGDVIVDGAFVKLDEMLKSGYSGFNHGSEPVGWFEEAKEDLKGLFVKIAFHSTEEAQKIRKIIQERLAAGKDVGMSIMYRTLDSSWGEREGKEVRELKAIEVKEAGFVTIPANVSATVTSVKGGSGISLDEKYEAARASVDDLISSYSDLNEKCEGELSAGRVAKIEEMHQKWGGLLESVKAKAQKEEPAMATEEDVALLAQRLSATLGVTT